MKDDVDFVDEVMYIHSWCFSKIHVRIVMKLYNKVFLHRYVVSLILL